MKNNKPVVEIWFNIYEKIYFGLKVDISMNLRARLNSELWNYVSEGMIRINVNPNIKKGLNETK